MSVSIRLVVLATLVVANVCCATIPATGGEPRYERSVSIIHLISAPQEVEGVKVRVAGYLTRTLNLYLYLSEEYAKLGDINSAVGVDSEGLDQLVENGCLDRYVWVIGDFRRMEGGEFAIRPLTEVWLASPMGGKKVCWERE
jgi:hypothetical protein